MKFCLVCKILHLSSIFFMTPISGSTDPSCSYCASSSTWGAGSCNSGDVMLQSSVTKVGVHYEGSFGTSRVSPLDSEQQSSCPNTFAPYAGSRLGFIADYDADGWGSTEVGGEPNFAGDYFLPGTEMEGFVTYFTDSLSGAKFRHCNKGLASSCGSPIVPTSIDITSEGDKQSMQWIGTADGRLELSKITQVRRGEARRGAERSGMPPAATNNTQYPIPNPIVLRGKPLLCNYRHHEKRRFDPPNRRVLHAYSRP